jgi:hypothetical protein
LTQNKHLLDKAKEKKEETIVMGEAFSKAPANASEFKTVALKKRTIAEVTPDNLPN